MADSMTAKKAELSKPKAPDGVAGADSPGGVRGNDSAKSAVDAAGDSRAASTTVNPQGTVSGGVGGLATARNESEHGKQKRAEFQAALRHFGNRIKAHNAGDWL